MFCVLYEFKIKSGMNDQFERSWAEFTEAIHQVAGSLGSRLHKTKDPQIYVAYAQWPSKDVFEKARTVTYSADQLTARENMRASTDSTTVLHELEMTDDRLR